MPETARNLVVVVTHGTDHELSSVAFTIANGGMTAGLKVSVFLTSAGVDLVRKRALDTTHVAPLDPLAALVKDFQARGGHPVGMYSVREGPRLHPGGLHRGRDHHRGQPHARAHQGRRRHPQLLDRGNT
jgi:predicted peroxiredoxin